MSVNPTFGAPVAPPSPVAVEEPAPTGRRTLVIAVAAGVAALGVLGGAAALVLGGDEEIVLSAVPPAAVQPVPGAEPSAAPTASAPLPTAAVQGRNVFVPLVGDAGDAVAGEGGAAAPADGSPAEGGAPTGGTDGTSGTGGSEGPGTAVVVTPDPEQDAALAAAEQRVLDLQAEIAALTQQLADGGDHEALHRQVQALTGEQDRLVAENVVLRKQAQGSEEELARLRTVVFVSADADAAGDPLQLTVDAVPVTLDLLEDPEPGAADHPAEVELGTGSGSTVPVTLAYKDLDAVEGTVLVQVGSALYRVSLGGQLTFTIG